MLGGGQSALSVSLSEPYLVSSEEDLSRRNQTTRVIINHYEQDVLDSAGNPTGEKVSYDRKIIIKADGLCYDAQDYTANPKASPLWEPAVPEFTPADPGKSGIAFTALRGVIQVSISTDIARSYPLECGFKHRNKAYTLEMGIAGLGYYDSESGKVVVVKEPESVPAEQTESNRLLYRGIFGEIADVEYVYERGRFKQNLIINSLAGLPGPAYFGLNPESTYLVIISRLKSASDSALIESRSLNAGFSELSAEAKVEGGYVAIRFKDAKTGKVLTEFAASGEAADALYDETKFSKEMTTHRSGIYKVLSRKADGSYELAEGVKVSWLSAERRQFPVVLDWELRSGTAQGSECWHAGETYYIQDNYTIPSAHTLAIEGGTVVKLNSNKQIRVSDGAELKAQGTKFNYVIFTSADDDSVGEMIPSGEYTPGPGYRIYFEPTDASVHNGSIIRYCKFSNLRCGLYFVNITMDTVGNLPCICDNIFRDFVTAGICVDVDNSQESVNLNIFNCLFVGNGSNEGIFILCEEESQNSVTMLLYNCTFDGLMVGLEYMGLGSLNLTIKDNLFTNCDASLLGEGCDVSGSSYDYNAFYEAPVYCDMSPPSPDNNLYLTNNPYEYGAGSPNGDYYTAEYVFQTGIGFYHSSLLHNEGERFSDNPPYPSCYINQI
ncbi:hypothetical protein J7M23_01715, partial [Candidatus Sumerlaeota bacterium]|nr:hypothetical protein [Candidatus Sumerlaeota bacterium]